MSQLNFGIKTSLRFGKILLISLLSSSLLLLSGSCYLVKKKRPKGSLDEFYRIPTLAKEAIDFKLAKVEKENKLNGLNLSYQVYQYPLHFKEGVLPVYHLDVEFKELTKRQFDFLKVSYSWGTSTITYPLPPDAKPYYLSDFLPPAIQATVGLGFKQEFGFDPDTFRIGYVMTNCWGAVYEVLRNDPRLLSVFYEEQKMPSLLWDNVLSTQILHISLKDSTTAQIMKKLENLNYGNVLIFYGDRLGRDDHIGHVSFFIDQSLVFEKGGVEDSFPYRLADLKSIVSRWKEFYSHLVVRDFLKGKHLLQHPFKHFVDIIEGKQSSTLERNIAVDIPYIKDPKTGRVSFHLEETFLTSLDPTKSPLIIIFTPNHPPMALTFDVEFDPTNNPFYYYKPRFKPQNQPLSAHLTPYILISYKELVKIKRVIFQAFPLHCDAWHQKIWADFPHKNLTETQYQKLLQLYKVEANLNCNQLKIIRRGGQTYLLLEHINGKQAEHRLSDQLFKKLINTFNVNIQDGTNDKYEYGVSFK